MKLLIVDDQQASLQGLACNIPWEQEGFDQVETARNAMEARLCFQRGVPDVMLCDIEMPVENGIDLCRWVRQNNYPTKMLFLTCHAKFDYAKDAIELGVVDYIVQPTPYETIQSKIHQIVELIAQQEQLCQLQKLGRDYELKHSEIVNSLWRDYIQGAVSAKKLDSMPGMPSTGESGHLIMMQVVHWDKTKPIWQDDLMAAALQNIAAEVFENVASRVLAVNMMHNIYAILVQTVSGEALDAGELDSLLEYLTSAYIMYMPCEVAFYRGDYLPVAQMPEAWRQLIVQRERNVAGQTGVYTQKETEDEILYTPQATRWAFLLQEKGVGEMEAAVTESLHALVKNGISAAALIRFHQDFAHLCTLLGSAHSDVGHAVHALMESAKGQRLYLEAAHSVEHMHSWIQATTQCISEQAALGHEAELVARIQSYVAENLQNEIRKEGISALVHLNGDYITRVFKKNTGYSIKGYIIRQKLLEARELLRTTSLSISNVAVQMGYSNFSHFSALYKREFGISPAEEQRGKANLQQ